MIVDPWGEIIVEAGEVPSMMTAELDLARLEEIRRKIPCLSHRRL
jgi:predicted amidohydrolase